MDGIKEPDMIISEQEFQQNQGLVRLIDGKIFLGKTEKEREVELAWMKINELKSRLSETDYVAAKIAEGSATKEEYAKQINQRKEWREEIGRLEKIVMT